MFVWNHFTNDARVLRECTALSEKGYSVDLICIEDPSDTSLSNYEERNEHFHVYRVKRYPVLLDVYKYIVTMSKKHLWFMLLVGIMAAFLIYIMPLVSITAIILSAIILKTRLKGVIIKGNIIIRMILRGFRNKYAIYHSNDLNTLPQGYICSKWRWKKRKLIYDSHEVQTSRTGYDSPIYGKMESWLLRRVDSMIVENHTRAKYNEELYGLYPHVVHNYPFINTIPLEEKVDLHQILGLPRDEKILLYQGGIQTGRGLDKLIEAAPFIKEGVIVLIGDGKIKEQLVKKVNELQLEEKVKFLPKVPLSDLPKYTLNAYLGFQILNNVCFNHYSASSNKLFEYLQANVPVVACSFPEIRRVVEGDHVGICIDSHNPQQIAEAVNLLIENTQLRDAYSANARKASKKYNWELEKETFISVYNTIA